MRVGVELQPLTQPVTGVCGCFQGLKGPDRNNAVDFQIVLQADNRMIQYCISKPVF